MLMPERMGVLDLGPSGVISFGAGGHRNGRTLCENTGGINDHASRAMAALPWCAQMIIITDTRDTVTRD